MEGRAFQCVLRYSLADMGSSGWSGSTGGSHNVGSSRSEHTMHECIHGTVHHRLVQDLGLLEVSIRKMLISIVLRSCQSSHTIALFLYLSPHWPECILKPGASAKAFQNHLLYLTQRLVRELSLESDEKLQHNVHSRDPVLINKAESKVKTRHGHSNAP